MWARLLPSHSAWSDGKFRYTFTAIVCTCFCLFFCFVVRGMRKPRSRPRLNNRIFVFIIMKISISHDYFMPM